VNSLGLVGSGIPNDTCNESKTNEEKTNEGIWLKEKELAMYGTQTLGAYQNENRSLTSEIDEKESEIQVKSKTLKGEAATILRVSNSELCMIEHDNASGGGQAVRITGDKIETKFESLAATSYGATTLTSSFSDSSNHVAAVHSKSEALLASNECKTANEMLAEVEEWKNKYHDTFGMGPRGPYQNKISWLKEKISNWNPKHDNELNELKKKYLSLIGLRPRGSHANHIWWLKLKIKEKESEGLDNVKPVTVTRQTPIIKDRPLPSIQTSHPPSESPKLRKKRKRGASMVPKNAGDHDRIQPSSDVTAQDVAECIIAAQVAMAKSATDPGVMSNLAKAAELIAKKQYPQLMVTTGKDAAIEKFSFKGAVTVKCGTCKQSNMVKFKFNS